jgi:hypothetical protein
MARKNSRRAAPPGAAIVVSGQTLNAAQAQIWRIANENIGSGEFDRIKRGVQALRALHSELAGRAAALAVRSGLAESLALAVERGEKVEVLTLQDAPARVRIRTRDGLETLQRSGAISAAQFKAGMLYRDLYEATDPERDLRSQMANLDQLSGGGSGPGEAWAERRLRLAGAIATIEAKVRLADRDSRAVRMLREVAGHARSLGAMFSGGGSQALGKRALITALDVCAAHFRLS